MRATEFSSAALAVCISIIILTGFDVSSALQPTETNNVEKITLEAALALRYQRFLKQKEFKKTKEEALKYIPKEIRPGELLIEGNFTSVIMEYDGEPMPLYIIVIAMIPLVLAELCRLFWNLVRPKLKFQQEGGGEFPFTACYHLQESLREQSLKRPARNCTSWFVHQYILSIEDETLEWKDVIDSLQLPQLVRKRKPWQTIRLIFRLKNALKKIPHKDDELLETEDMPILAGNHIECHLRTRPSEDTLHLESQISQLELYYKTLNSLEKDYEVPSPPHPELFTVRELMEFMTRDEKLLVLRCFDKSQMNELMINCNIEEIRKRNAEFVQAHMEAAQTVYDHVEVMKSKPSIGEKEPTATPAKEKSIQTLFDIKDKLAKEIVEANDKLLDEWEKSAEQIEVKEAILNVLEPIHIKRTNETPDQDLLQMLAMKNESEELKVKPLTSEERVEHLIKKAEDDIDDMEQRIKVKKKLRKKAKAKVKMNDKKKANEENELKEQGKNKEKVPFNWQRKSDDKNDEIPKVVYGPKLKYPPPARNLKIKKAKHRRTSKKKEEPDDTNLQENENEDNKNETERKRMSGDESGGKEHETSSRNKTGIKGRRNTDDTTEEPRRVSAEDDGVKGKQRISGDEEKEKRKTSTGKKTRKSSREKEKRRASGEDDNQKLLGSEAREPKKRRTSGDKETRKLSERVTETKEERKLSEEKPEAKVRPRLFTMDLAEKEKQKEISDEQREKKKRRISEDEPGQNEKRKISGDEPGEREHRKHSGNEPEERGHRKHSGNEPEERKRRKHSGNEPEAREHRKHSGNESGEREHRKHSGNEPGESEHRKHSGNEPEEKEHRKHSGNVPGEREHRKHPGNEPEEKEHRKHSGNEPGEREHRKHSGNEPGEKEHRKHSGNEPGEKEHRKHSGNEPGEREQRKHSGNEPEEGEHRKYSGNEPGEREHRKQSGDESDEKEHRKHSGNEPGEREHRKHSGNEPGEKEKRRTSDDEARKKFGNETRDDENQLIPENGTNEKERRKLSQDKQREKERQGQSVAEKEKRKLSEKDDKGDAREIPPKEEKDHSARRTSEKDDDKERRISEEENAAIAIQTHHHHHHNQDLPIRMMGQQENKHRNSGNKNPETGHDVHAVHDATVDQFLKQTQKKNLTKSAEMAIHRDFIFQESENHPKVKIYSQGRRAKFDTIKHGHATKPDETLPQSSPHKGDDGDNTKTFADNKTETKYGKS